jgi:hypothetical protein
MLIDTTTREVEFYEGRLCNIYSVGTNLRLISNEEPEPSLIQTKSVKSQKTETAVQSNLIRTGFQPISQTLTLDDIESKSQVNLLNTIKNDIPLIPASINISIDKKGSEDIVAIEFDPVTGEILDWYQPVSFTLPNKNFNSNFTTLLDRPVASPKMKVVFEIPLYNTYPDDKEAYSQNKNIVSRTTSRFKKVIRFFSLRKLKKYARKAVGKVLTGPVRFLDRKIVSKQTLGIFKPKGKPTDLTSSEIRKLEGQRGLLFVHGIISNTTGAFGRIQADKLHYEQLNRIYDNNLLAFDHWTLSKDIFQNANFLASKLPKNMTLDIVCHSRGAAVIRSLLELPEIQEKLTKRNIRINQVCFIAGACEGSQLATGNALENIFKTINKFGVLLGTPSLASSLVSYVIKLVLGGLQELPGTDSMDPIGKYLEKLNASSSTLANQYNYFRSNFDPKNVIAAQIDQAIIDKAIFNNQANDVIVPFEGAGITPNYLDGKVVKKLIKEYGTENEPQSNIWHINFFHDYEMRNLLIETLA